MKLSIERLATPLLALTAGCMLDTTPIVNSDPIAVGPAAEDAGMSMSPSQATASVRSSVDAATTSPADAAVADAGAPPAARPPAAATQMANPVTMPAAAPAKMPSPGLHCDASGSYGLRARIDVAWDATAWADTGRGTVELYGLLDVATADPQTRATSASFRGCGLILPMFSSSATCSSYQLQFPQAMWDGSRLPELSLDGSFECGAASCALRLPPISYLMGIQLADAQGPWPSVEETTPSQFSDDDEDGFAGVSADVVALASVVAGQSGCDPSDDSDPGAGPGPGPGGPGWGWGPGSGPAGPGNPTTTQQVPAELGSVPMGLRAQLTAAMQFAADCKLGELAASDATLGLRPAGCFVSAGTDPASASSSCSEELRVAIDEGLPSYEVLDKGAAPKHSGASDKKPSAGTTLEAVRFAPGRKVSCDQVSGLF